MLSFAIVGSLQTVGIVLVLSMLLIPAASAKLITNKFTQSIKLSAVFGLISSVSGLYFSYYLNLPTGPAMSMVATLIFIVSLLLSMFKQKILI